MRRAIVARTRKVATPADASRTTTGMRTVWPWIEYVGAGDSACVMAVSIPRSARDPASFFSSSGRHDARVHHGEPVAPVACDHEPARALDQYGCARVEALVGQGCRSRREDCPRTVDPSDR